MMRGACYGSQLQEAAEAVDRQGYEKEGSPGTIGD
jgi:hypothetical protein